MDAKSQKIVIIGQGYVGLPVAMRAVEVGYDVVGLDLDAARVERLAGGSSYVGDISDETLRAALDSGRFLPTADYAAAEGFDVAVITVPTPLKETLPDLSFIEQSGKSLAPYVTPGSVVVLESTTYPGTTEEMLVPILEAGSGLRAGADFHVGYSPERIDPGNKKYGFVETPKVVSGIDAASLARVDAFYSSLIERTVPVSGTKEAELTKLLENTFRHVNIALVNELAVFAHQLDIDIWESIDAASSKPFGFMAFTPGPGVGGHCLPVDPSYLSWQVRRTLGQSFRFIELANDVNEHMPDHVVTRLATLLNDERKAVRGSKVLLLGLAYKRDTNDIRESPSLKIVELLTALGADILAVDDLIDDSRWPAGVKRVALTEKTLADVDAALVVTAHSDQPYHLLVENDVPTLDTQRVLRGPKVSLL
ncbi:UDP-N-acetyl-D-glucosamine dehydrogenase [Flavimobilis soli]|uniref:UDP-N-acetyl-D-glucosamine dehydrogenase n=1 Tax=Flavimobilis soli TaxID=442709 RepID=A0A2A9EBC2_9MICO|nr:nucleotide sugar dehydrogenase [Flavimobilis soli]PFG35552.1 UDP-N-acetyl-D-glucosamine dehydrogenase [Flavimobilis soli]